MEITSETYISLNNLSTNAGWAQNKAIDLTLVTSYFIFCVPLKMIPGFAEGFNKTILNSKHELILLHSKYDTQKFGSGIASEKMKMKLADAFKLEIFTTVSSCRSLNISFRIWNTYYYNSQGTTILWNVKLTSENKRSRYLLVFYNNQN